MEAGEEESIENKMSPVGAFIYPSHYPVIWSMTIAIAGRRRQKQRDIFPRLACRSPLFRM